MQRQGQDEDGLYVSALRQGLSSVLLPYRRAVEAMEARVLRQGGATSLSQVQHAMEPFAPVVLALDRLIKQVRVFFSLHVEFDSSQMFQ